MDEELELKDYKVFREGSKFVVHKVMNGKKGPMVPGGKHDTEEEAKAHMRALYANVKDVKKETGEADTSEVATEEKAYDGMADDMPYFGPISLGEIDEMEDQQERAMEISDLSSRFSLVSRTIISHPLLDLKEQADALHALADEWFSRANSIVSEDEQDDSDSKELDEKAKWTTASMNDLPDSAFLYIESGGKKVDGKTEPRSLRHLPVRNSGGELDAAHVRNAIARAPLIKLSSGQRISPKLAKSLQSKAQKLLERVNKGLDEISLLDQIKLTMKELLNGKQETEEVSPIFIWKESDDGLYRWIARFSNNFRDDDGVPEILSARSHIRFIERVNKGELPYPELWLWHRKEWKIGQATWLAWDDSGFALAAGYFTKEAEPIAEKLKELGNFAVSHGMRKDTILRDKEDPTIIVDYETAEISPLPRWAAANKLTGFMTLVKEDDMAMTKEDKQKALENLKISPRLLDLLEEANAKDATAAKEAGVQNKETNVTAETPPAVETPTPPEATPPATTTTEAAPEPPQPDSKLNEEPPSPEGQESTPPAETPETTPKESGETSRDNLLAELILAQKGFVEAIQGLNARLDAIETSVKEKNTAVASEISKIIRQTPSVSLDEILKSRAVGAEETKIKGTEHLSRIHPKEATPQPITGISFIDRIINNGEE